MLDEGVDGNGSQPLQYILTQPGIQKSARDFFMCAHSAFDLHDFYPPNDWLDPTSREEEQENRPHVILYPDELTTTIVTIAQLLDGALYRGDFSGVEDCDPIEMSSIEFYGCFFLGGKYFIDPILDCTGLPSIPEVVPPDLPTLPSRPTSPSRPTPPAPTPPLRDLDRPHTAESTTGRDNGDDIVDRLRSCEAAVCGRIDATLTSVEDAILGASGRAGDWRDDVGSTFMVVINLGGCLFAAVAALGFFCFDAILAFPADRRRFNRETSNGAYGTVSFFFGRTAADIPFQWLPALLFATSLYWLVGFTPKIGVFLVFILICVLTNFAAYGFCYFVSTASPRVEVTLLVAPCLMILMMVMAGFILRGDAAAAWIRWFRYVSIHHYAWFAAMANEFRGDSGVGFLTDEQILNLFGIDDSRVWFNTLMLFVLGVGFRLLGLACLHLFYRHHGLE